MLHFIQEIWGTKQKFKELKVWEDILKDRKKCMENYSLVEWFWQIWETYSERQVVLDNLTDNWSTFSNFQPIVLYLIFQVMYKL